MSVELKLDPRTVFAFVLIFIGVIVILHGVYRALVDVDQFSSLIGTEITQVEAYVQTLTWFFGLLIEILGGFFLALIGTRIIKK